jgi:hypothetical protein
MKRSSGFFLESTDFTLKRIFYRQEEFMRIIKNNNEKQNEKHPFHMVNPSP